MSSVDSPPWYVLSGGPSSGKSTTIEILRKRGFTVTEETARAIIQDELAAGRSLEEIRGNGHDFQRRILLRQQELESHLDPEEIVFLDRGIPDGLAYSHLLDLGDDSHLHEAANKAKYRKIFILDLLELEDDGSRIEDRDTQHRLQDFLIATYETLSFDVVKVPVMEREKRVDYILERL